jgi:hypothetical protein
VAKLLMQAKSEGLTLKEIGDAVGKSFSWVDKQLRFGRFLRICTTCTNSFSPAKPLTEGRFRNNWKESGKRPKETEDERFARVLELVKKDDNGFFSKHAHRSRRI